MDDEVVYLGAILTGVVCSLNKSIKRFAEGPILCG